jgi:hypothetical protein
MPGAVGTEFKMDKKKKLERKKLTDAPVAGMFTLDAAYAKYKMSRMNGKKAGKVDTLVADQATVRDGSVNGAHVLANESTRSFVARNQKSAVSFIEKESCITEDRSGSDNSESIDSPELQTGASKSGLPQSVSVDRVKNAKGKRKRYKPAESSEEEVAEVPVKAQKLSEEARVWQYVCKRSVFVSPPQQVQKLDQKQTFRSIPAQFGQDVFREKTSKLDVKVDGKVIKVTLTKESLVAQEWLKRQTGKVFGLDLEWQPNRRKGQRDNKVALMQISSDTECLLIQMLFLDSIPSVLIQFLKDPERKIVGVGIHGDTKVSRTQAQT